MKKFISLFMAIVLVVSAGFGQAKQNSKKVVTTTVSKPGIKVSTTTVTKNDGTPDKRFKVNKVTHSKTVVLKKDGTPDKRYKAPKKA